MGGAVSQFESNEWELADGGITDGEETVDGAEPLDEYKVFTLVKKAVLANQREFDVTDDDSNLLYSIRPSPGTIAGFDVLAASTTPTTDEYLLRIIVDIARRIWIVYRFDRPAFEGQKPDKAATAKFNCEQSSKMDPATQVSEALQSSKFEQTSSCEQRKLYKMCCITVSWSRYLSVAAFYGPPTVGQICGMDLSLKSQASSINSSLANGNRNTIPPDQQSGDGESEYDVLGNANKTTNRALADELESEVDNNNYKASELESENSVVDRQIGESLSHLDPPFADNTTASLTTSSSMPELGHESSASTSTRSFRTWIRKTTSDFTKTSVQVDPMEGVVHLDKPLLLCQEIYHKIIGNHQTSRVSKAQVLKLLKEDMEQHLLEQSEIEEPILDVADDEDCSESSESTNDKNKQQPIVGYWHWEHTLRVHKMRMHLAKNTDVALHVVLSIIVNQVRYERNAVAMTV